jgi:hypothetical protein
LYETTSRLPFVEVSVPSLGIFLNVGGTHVEIVVRLTINFKDLVIRGKIDAPNKPESPDIKIQWLF